MKKNLKFFGHNNHEFPISVVIIVFSLLVLLPSQARESSRFLPTLYYENQVAAKVSTLFVVMMIGLFCSLNAYRDARISGKQKKLLSTWSLLLLIFMTGAIVYLLKWWFALPPSLKQF